MKNEFDQVSCFKVPIIGPLTVLFENILSLRDVIESIMVGHSEGGGARSE